VNTVKTLLHHSSEKLDAFGNSAHLVAAAFCKGVLKPLALALFVMGADFGGEESADKYRIRGGSRIVSVRLQRREATA
jgi:hypothetical protein